VSENEEIRSIFSGDFLLSIMTFFGMPNLVMWKISGFEHDQQTIGKI